MRGLSRTIALWCEFGLVGQSMHQVDEHVKVAHIHQLKSIYGRILRDYFA